MIAMIDCKFESAHHNECHCHSWLKSRDISRERERDECDDRFQSEIEKKIRIRGIVVASAVFTYQKVQLCHKLQIYLSSCHRYREPAHSHYCFIDVSCHFFYTHTLLHRFSRWHAMCSLWQGYRFDRDSQFASSDTFTMSFFSTL